MRDVLLTPSSERKSAMIDCKPLIVVVHEDPEVLDALESVLTGSDYLAATFTSAQRSIGFISRTKPDLVLAQQPGIRSHGIEFLESIKQISPSTEGIFLPSPLDLDPESRRLRRAQADELLRIVERLMGISVLPERRRSPQ